MKNMLTLCLLSGILVTTHAVNPIDYLLNSAGHLLIPEKVAAGVKLLHDPFNCSEASYDTIRKNMLTLCLLSGILVTTHAVNPMEIDNPAGHLLIPAKVAAGVDLLRALLHCSETSDVQGLARLLQTRNAFGFSGNSFTIPSGVLLPQGMKHKPLKNSFARGPDGKLMVVTRKFARGPDGERIVVATKQTQINRTQTA